MRLIQAGTTDQSIIVRALTSAGATATPVYTDSGIAATYKRDATGTATTITLATQTSTGAHSDGGFVHIGGGVCRLDLPDAAVADGATRVTVTINATAWVGFTEEILLVDYDPTGPVTADVTKWNGTAVASPHTAGYPVVTVKDGTGTGEIDTNAGAVVNVTNVGTLTTYTGNTPQTGDAYARIGAAGAGLTAVGDTAGTTTLLSRLSAARAGYLDNLSAGAVALASALTTAQADLTTLVGRITGAVALATSTTAAAIRAALGMASANLDTNIPGVLQTKAQADTDQTAVLASVALRLLTSDYTAPPSVSAIADQVWDEILSGHAISGSAGAALSLAGSAADPMTNDPADYTSGQLGYLIGRLAGGRITVRGMVTPSGDMDEVVGGADYSATDGYSFDWTDADSELAWPDLTSATVSWVGRSPDGQETTLAMTVVTPTGDKVVRLAMTAAQTAALVAMQTGPWTFTVWATLSSGRERPLVKGTVPVVQLVGP